MKAIQSFFLFDDFVPYCSENEKKSNRRKQLLNFYTQLLSCLTITEHYKKPTMYTNQKAYDLYIKDIPYESVVVMDNFYGADLWSVNKINVIKQMNDDFIHIDPDVFIFDRLFDDFETSKKYEIIVQDTVPPKNNHYRNFIYQNIGFFEKNPDVLLSPKTYDGKFVSCGTIGMKKELINGYIELTNLLLDGFFDKELIFPDQHSTPVIIEELGMYYYLKKNDIDYMEILPYDKVLKTSNHEVGNLVKYTHLWGTSKYDDKIIQLIKKKINKKYPEYESLVNKYDKIIEGLK